MKRYLLYFSYIGTGFRGVQRQIPRESKVKNEIPTVVEVIEIAIKRILRLPTLPVLYMCSRTDAGVHALKTAGNINLNLETLDLPTFITLLNHEFEILSCPVRILDAQRVKSDFNARALVTSRTYLYRFAVSKETSNYFNAGYNRYVLPQPITEYKRCHFVYNSHFDLDAVNKVLELFPGTKDFCTFSSKCKKNARLPKQEVNTVKTLESIEVVKGSPLLPSPLDVHYDYYNFTCTSKSFLYNQVRRMVSAVLAVANHTLTYDKVKYFFDNPSYNNWNPSIACTAPACGLYLSNIKYNKEDLIEPIDEQIAELSPDIITNSKELTLCEKINT